MNAPLLIGLCGRANAGKSTVAGMLAHEFAFEEIAFADPIVNMIGALFADADIGSGWMTERALKEQPTRLGFSYRELAQTLGTEWGRQLHPEFWLRVAALKLERASLHHENVVFSDVRFPNEAKFITQRGGVLVRVLRDTAPTARAHSSEAYVDTLPVTTELLNFGSKETLLDQVDRLITTLRVLA